MTLAQMACAASMAVYVSPDFDPNYRGFLFSYAGCRGLLVLMYWRAAVTSTNDAGRAAAFLGSRFAMGLAITLTSLWFERPWNYAVLYVGLAFDLVVPLFGRRHLARAPVEGHHLPERFALLTIILLGESVASLVSTLGGAAISASAATAAAAGFILTAAIWWTYYENLEHRIYGRSLGTGQAVIYVHLAIYVSLGGIANMIRFAIEPVLALSDYKLLAGLSATGFLASMQLLHLAYHPRAERGALLRDASVAFALVGAALFFATTNQTVLLPIAAIFVAHAGRDALWRRAHRRRAGEPAGSARL
jgi:low temperature requirement protein LtrA